MLFGTGSALTTVQTCLQPMPLGQVGPVSSGSQTVNTSTVTDSVSLRPGGAKPKGEKGADDKKTRKKRGGRKGD